jgi:hypothetical protein
LQESHSCKTIGVARQRNRCVKPPAIAEGSR